MLASLAIVCLAAAPTPAFQRSPVITSVNYEYLPPNLTVAQGKSVNYTNLDIALHNVFSVVNGKNGEPLFWSKTIEAGKSVPVEGVRDLAPGVYDYTCTLHTFMTGSITVTD